MVIGGAENLEVSLDFGVHFGALDYGVAGTGDQ